MRLQKHEIETIRRDHDTADYDKRVQIQTLCDMALDLLEKEDAELDAEVDPITLKRTHEEMLAEVRKAQKHAEHMVAKLESLEGTLQESLEELG